MGYNTFRRRAVSGGIGSGAMVGAHLRFSHYVSTDRTKLQNVRARLKRQTAASGESRLHHRAHIFHMRQTPSAPLPECLRYLLGAPILLSLPAIGHNGIALRSLGRALCEATLPAARHPTHISLLSQLQKNNRNLIISPSCHPLRTVRRTNRHPLSPRRRALRPPYQCR